MNNPEFLRYLWLDMSIHRLLGLPVVIALVCLSVWLPAHQASAVALTAQGMGILLGLWGVHLAAESQLGEVRNATWHAQRMSALSPWQLAWGKLFGSTLFAWLGIALCLLIYLFTTPEPLSNAWPKVVVMVQGALLMQAMALLFTLALSEHMQEQRKASSFIYTLATVFILLPILITCFEAWNDSIDWYGTPVPTPQFAMLSLGVFLAWSWLGIYRLMGAALQIPQGISVWLGFLLWAQIFLINAWSHVQIGWVPWNISTIHGDAILITILGTLLLVYPLLTIEDSDAIAIRRWVLALGQRQARALAQATPCWLATWCMAVLGTVLLALILPEAASSLAFLFACLLFVLRDCALLLWIRLREDYRPVHRTAAATYILCSYTILPAILGFLGLEMLIPWFLPETGMPAPDLLYAALEAGLALYLLHARSQHLGLLSEPNR